MHARALRLESSLFTSDPDVCYFITFIRIQWPRFQSPLNLAVPAQYRLVAFEENIFCSVVPFRSTASPHLTLSPTCDNRYKTHCIRIACESIAPSVGDYETILPLIPKRALDLRVALFLLSCSLTKVCILR